MKKHIFTALSLICASALLVLALGCTGTTPQTQNVEHFGPNGVIGGY
jgi:hypothetical protein